MANENNLIENGSFKDRNIDCWNLAQGDPSNLVFHDYTPEKKVVLLEPGQILEQSIDASRIGPYRSFLLKITARASQNRDATCIGLPELAPASMQVVEPSSGVNDSTTLLTVSFSIDSTAGQTPKTLFAQVLDAMQPFEAHVTFENLPQALQGASIRCQTPDCPFPDQARKYLWVTALKVIPLA